MRCRRLILASGTALTILTVPAMAQYEQPKTTTTARAGSVEPVLSELEGTWRVQLEVDPQFWSVFHSTMSADSDRAPGDRREGANPDNNPGSQTKADTRAPDDQTIEGAVTLKGFARTKLMLDDNVLHERCVIEKPATTSSGSTTSRTSTSSYESGKSQALSLIAFDEDRQRYNLIIINARGKVHRDIGEYDSGSRRIVFNGYGPMRHVDPRSNQDPANRSHEPSGADKNLSGSPQDAHDGVGWSASPSSDMSNVRVVLEIVSPDEHRVTMYRRGYQPMTDDSSRPGTPPNDRSNRSDPAASHSDTNSDRTKETSIVYRATYKRVSSSESAEADRALQDDDASKPNRK